MGGEVDLQLLYLLIRTFIASMLFVHLPAQLQLSQEQNPGIYHSCSAIISDFNYLSILMLKVPEMSAWDSTHTHRCPASFWPEMFLHLQPA